MIAIGAVVIAFYPPVAGIFLIIGLSLLWRRAYLDRKYGKDRPTPNEVDLMSVEDYKRRTRNDPRFTKWINHLGRSRTTKPFDSNDY